MKKILLLCAIIASSVTCGAQNVIDHFTVGPYTVDYMGNGDVRYRLRDNIDLFEFFELQKDTTIVAAVKETPVKNAIQISARAGANRFSSQEFGIEGVWKHKIANNLYFNGGLSLAIGHTNYGEYGVRRNMFEVGVPLQLELGKLCREHSSLYGLVAVAPTVYTTMSSSLWENGKRVDGIKKSGFLIAPSLEFGGNIPVGNVIMRIGVYGTFKANCTTSDFDVYRNGAGRAFGGAKIGLVL